MASYSYKARNDSGKVVKGITSAVDEIELGSILEEKGLYLVDFSETTKTSSGGQISFGKKVTHKEIHEFTSQMSMIVDAGVPVIQGIEDLASKCENPYFKKVMNAVKEDVTSGESLSKAMGKYPKVFNDLYLSMIKGGEATGELGQALDSLAGFLEWQIDLNSMIKGATLMPKITTGAMVFVVGLLLVFLYPQFAKLFKDMGIPLPDITKFFIGLSDFLRNQWHVILGSYVGYKVLFKIIKSNKSSKFYLDKFYLNIPLIGDLIRKIAIYRFAKIFSTLFGRGVEISHILVLMGNIMGNAVLEKVVKNARENIIAGQTMSSSFEASGEFPPLIVRMIAVGEQTGKLDVTLGRVAAFYDKDIPIEVKKLVTILQPILILILAVLVLGIAISIFLPMYSLGGQGMAGGQ